MEAMHAYRTANQTSDDCAAREQASSRAVRQSREFLILYRHRTFMPAVHATGVVSLKALRGGSDRIDR